MSALFDELGLRNTIVDGETYVNVHDLVAHLYLSGRALKEKVVGEDLTASQQVSVISSLAVTQSIIEFLQEGLVDSQFDKLVENL